MRTAGSSEFSFLERATRPVLLPCSSTANRIALAIACAALVLSGCAGRTSATRANTDAASITYALPETRVAVGLDVVLTDCSGKFLQIEPTLSLVPRAISGTKRYTLSADQLASFSKQREVAITLYDNGTLQSVNAAVSDRSLIIATNVIKLATLTVGAVGLATAAVVPECNKPTTVAISRLKLLLKLQDSLKDALASSKDPETISKAREAIVAVALEIADLRSGPLRLELKSMISLPGKETVSSDGTVDPVEISWNKEPFLKWVDSNYADAAASRLALKMPLQVVSPSGVAQSKADAIASDETEPSCGKAPCPSLVIRSPVLAIAEVRPAHPEWWLDPKGGQIKVLGKALIPVAQWGNLTYLPLTAKFASSGSVKIALDPFGRKTILGLASEARGEVLTGGLVAAGDAITVLGKTLAAPTELQQQLAKIAELEALQKYNKLIKCEEILKAGGHECPN